MQSKALTIAIIELGTHHEVLWSVYHQCRTEYEHIHVITTDQNHMFLKQELKPGDSTSMHITKPNTSLDSLFKSLAQVFEACDHILITTLLPRHFSYFIDWRFRKKSLLLIHDLHFHFASDIYRIAPSSIKEIARLLKYKIKQYQSLAISIVKEYRCLACSASVLSYAIQNQYESVVDHLNLGLSISRNKPLAKRNEITIVIPGSVSSSRRDYEPVLSALGQCQLDQAMTLILAGSIEDRSGQGIIENFKKINHPLIEVKSYESEISHELYLKILSEADYLLLPIAEYKNTEIIKERYGYSSHSGAIQDITRYGTPTMIPSHYPIPDAINHLVRTYTNAEMLQSLLEECTPQELKLYEYVKDRGVKELFMKHLKLM